LIVKKIFLCPSSLDVVVYVAAFCLSCVFCFAGFMINLEPGPNWANLKIALACAMVGIGWLLGRVILGTRCLAEDTDVTITDFSDESIEIQDGSGSKTCVLIKDCQLVLDPTLDLSYAYIQAGPIYELQFAIVMGKDMLNQLKVKED